MGATTGPRSVTAAWTGSPAEGGRLPPSGAAAVGERGGSAAGPGRPRSPVEAAGSPERRPWPPRMRQRSAKSRRISALVIRPFERTS
eukprot:4125079-Alexandrium_andersonii.AAC.1